MKLKLNKGKTLVSIGPMDLDSQDLRILATLVLLNLMLALLFGSYTLFGLILVGIIFRNILITKGQLKRT